MHVFKDRHGDEWTVEITIGTRERLKAKANIDLYNAENIKGLLDAIDDPASFAGILAVICEKEFAERELTIESFQERFNGDAIEAATEAFLEEFKLFIRPGMRPGVTKMLNKVRELQDKVSKRMEAMAEGTDIDRAVDRMMTKEENKLKSEISKFGNGPESSE